MKKLIISKTVIFIVVLLYVSVFKSIFGIENALIGVASAVTILMYLDRDLTLAPWRNLLFFVGYNLFQGLSAYVALQNKWIGIVLVFITFFSVVYFFTYNLKKSLYIPFGLQYIFLLCGSGEMELLPKQLMALVSSAVVLMVVQLVVNRNKFKKQSEKAILEICEQLSCVVKNGDNTTLHTSIQSEINELRKAIYNHREGGYYLTNEARLKLRIIASLESLYLEIKNISMAEGSKKFSHLLIEELQALKTIATLKEKEAFDDNLNTMKMVVNEQVKDIALQMRYFNIISTLELLHENILYIGQLQQSNRRMADTSNPIPQSFKQSLHFFAGFTKDSVRFTYAVRLAVVTTIGFIIWRFLDLENGRWIVITVYSVTQSYSEHAKFRSKDRLIGTLIGLVLFLILFTIFKDDTIRSMIILLAGYLNSFVEKYRYAIIGITIMALAGAVTPGSEVIFTLDRLIYTLVGLTVAIIANQFLLPYSIEDGTKKLIEMYKDISKTMVKQLSDGVKGNKDEPVMNHLFSITSLVEERIVLNNTTVESKEYESFLDTQRILNNHIFKLYLRMERSEDDREVLHSVFKKIEFHKENNSEKVESIIDMLKEDVQKVKAINGKIMISNVVEIFNGFQKNISI